MLAKFVDNSIFCENRMTVMDTLCGDLYLKHNSLNIYWNDFFL
jgi:hypothetical protein